MLWMMAGKRLTQFPTPDVHHGSPKVNCRRFVRVDCHKWSNRGTR
jgi:hypothetical protein